MDVRIDDGMFSSAWYDKLFHIRFIIIKNKIIQKHIGTLKIRKLIFFNS